MEELEESCLKRAKLACPVEDLNKLDTEEGCRFNVVTGQILSLDEDSASEDDEDDELGSYQRHIYPEALLERSKREYIALALNSDRDPGSSDVQSALAQLLEDDDGETECVSNIKDFRHLNKQYQNLTDFEGILKGEFSYESKGFKEISPDRVFKRELKAGTDDLVSDNHIVIYNYAFWTDNAKEPYDSSWVRQKTMVSDVEHDPLVPGFKELLLTTRKGEWCDAIIKPEAAFGSLGVTPRIPANATLFCILEVVKLVRKDKVAMLSTRDPEKSEVGAKFEDFIQAANEARTRGNGYFVKKQYKAAIQRYNSGVHVLETLTFKDETEEKRAQDVLLKLYNNLAKAANASDKPRLALHACKQASLLKPDIKTYWSKMKAWKIKGHMDHALNVARRAKQLFPSDPWIKLFDREVIELQEKIQEEKENTRNLYKLMGKSLVQPA